MNNEILEARKNYKDAYRSAKLSILGFFILYFIQAFLVVLSNAIPDPNAIQIFIGLSVVMYAVEIIPIYATFKHLKYGDIGKEEYELIVINRISDLEKPKEQLNKDTSVEKINKTKSKTNKISIDLSDSVTRQIKDIAKSTNKSENDIVEEILTDSLDFKSKK